MTATSVEHNTDEAKAKARRAERYHARHLLWDQSKLGRVRSCGRQNRSPEGVSVRVSTASDGSRTAGLAGVASCGSVWACPVCSAKIAAGRQADIEAGITAWEAQGGRVAFATFTMRHNKGHALRTLLDAVAAAWTATTSGRAWVADQKDHGQAFARLVKTGRRAGQWVSDFRVPTIRLWEVTHGDDGWHVHVHALLFLPEWATDESAELLTSGMYSRWESAFPDDTMRPTRQHGIDCRLLKPGSARPLGEYFTKGVYGDDAARSASFEMARSDLKDARWGNRTPWAILGGLVLAKSGEIVPDESLIAADEGLWAEWESATKGRRQTYWSPGLRAMLLPESVEELTDQELADVAPGGETVASIPGLVFKQVTRHRADWQLVSAFGRSDREGWAFLTPFFALAESAETARDARHGIRLRV